MLAATSTLHLEMSTLDNLLPRYWIHGLPSSLHGVAHTAGLWVPSVYPVCAHCAPSVCSVRAECVPSACPCVPPFPNFSITLP